MMTGKNLSSQTAQELGPQLSQWFENTQIRQYKELSSSSEKTTLTPLLTDERGGMLAAMLSNGPVVIIATKRP